jgi:class 3 adenylate cyclase
VRPETRYVKSGDVNIAFQVVGHGPIDLVYVPAFVSNIEMTWDEPASARYFERLASFSRLILFDKRGTGLSDRVPGIPTLEERMEDVLAVMNAAGAAHAALVGSSEGGPMCALFAATYPERTSALILYGAYPRVAWAPDYPSGYTEEQFQALLSFIEREWSTGAIVDRYAPSRAGDGHFRDWMARYLRMAASPGAAVAIQRMNWEIDVRAVLSSIRVPTLVLYRAAELISHVKGSQYFAGHIPGARYVELSGADYLPWVGDQDAIIGEIEEFLTGVRSAATADRILVTVLFVDIVGSTEEMRQRGDKNWRDVLVGYYATVRCELDRFRGREIDVAGDGLFATFDGPARAIRCACRIVEAVRPLGIETRTCLHTGECEVLGGKLAGIAVHIGARVASLAGPSEVLVSSTVKDLVAGSGLKFRERGVHELKGLPGAWPLYAVEMGS